MTTEGDRLSVFRTTKVRTSLKGDSSWIQQSKGPEQDDEEKPWVAEVRASRVNGAFNEPLPSAVAETAPEPQTPSSTDSTKTPSSGYLIRGVFTKTDNKPASSSNNGYIGTSGFVKRPSEGYKKIAPHTVRLSVPTEQPDSSLSADEQERRTEAASNVLKSSAGKQRSYVLSAAKKYESTEKANTDFPPVPSFVAKRVVISDDESNNPFELKAATPPASPAPVPQPTQKESVEMSVDELAPPVAAVRKKAPSSVPEPKPRVKPEPTPTQSEDTLDALSDTLLSTTPEPTRVSKPVVKVTPPVLETKTELKPEPTPKASATDPVPQAVPVTKEAPSKTSDTKPKTESTPTPSVTKSETPAVPLTKQVSPPAPEPKPVLAPKQSVPEPIAQVTPVAPVATVKKTPTDAPKPPAEVTSKTSAAKAVAPTPPVAQEALIPKLEPKAVPKQEPEAEIAPKQSVPDKTAPAEQKAPSITPAAKSEPTPKQSVQDPVPQKLPSTTPEPKPSTEPTPKQSVTKSETPKPVVKVTPPVLETKTELKPEPTPKASATDPVPQAVPVTKEAPSKTSDTKPKTESTPTPSVTKSETPAVPLTKQVSPPAPEPKPVLAPKQSIDQPLVKTSGWNDGNLLGLTQSTSQKSVKPVPVVTELLTGPESSQTESGKSSASLDLLAADIIPFDTNTNKTVTITEKTQITVQSNEPKSTVITSEKKSALLDLLSFDSDTKNNSADPFDPIEIADENTKSPVELFDPLLSDSENMPTDALSSLAKDVIPFDTEARSLSSESNVSSTNQSDGSEQHTVTVTFEKKSSDKGSPWDRWTTPTIQTSSEESETEADPEPMENNYTSYTSTLETSAQDIKSADPNAKKGFVYVKEYVNLSELSPQDNSSDPDYLTSTTSSYAYSSPSSAAMTACTYCGGMVGNDAKITIDHLNISCHPECFKCGICSKPMGDLLYNMFLHRGTVHCESCYANLL